VTAIAVLGAGGVGGFVAGAIARRGDDDVVVIARPGTAAELNDGGLHVSSAILGNFDVRLAAVTELTGEVDALVVATKAVGLGGALKRIQTTPRVVLPLLNGLEHLSLLRERFGEEPVLGSVIRIESDRLRTGEIVQTSPACRIDIADPPAGVATACERLVDTLQDAGIAVRVGGSEARVMWSKLARLCPLALTTSASDQPIGYVRSDPRWRSAMEGAVSETVRVANAQGADLSAEDTLAELDGAHAELSSSMARDIAAGREPELDPIAGAVLRAAARYGLRCPTISWLGERVAELAGLNWDVMAPGDRMCHLDPERL
jgi:2-dehydropantoate 2-reductase